MPLVAGFSAREAVAGCTPARAATSRSVGTLTLSTVPPPARRGTPPHRVTWTGAGPAPVEIIVTRVRRGRDTVLIMPSFRHPGTVLTDHTFTVPLDHDDPAGPPADRGVRARGGRDCQGRHAATVAGLPAGRPGQRLAAAGRPVELAGPGAAGLPGAAARPARHRPVTPGHTADPRPAGQCQGASRLPGALPGRFHRPGCRDHPPRAHRRRAVDRARPELRRILRGQLPVARAGGPARGA